MSQQRQPHMMSGNNQDQYSDTTFTKIFVGGLAWETQRDTMRRYFEQFGEILEAVVITDKYTGRSKGYGFVTFKDPEAAIRACQNPSPVIDGRRANCNIASLGANKNRSVTLQHGRFRPSHGVVAPAPYHGSSSSTIFHQPTRQYTFPYSTFGYSGYSQDTLYPANYYNVYGVQQYSPYYPSVGGAGTMGLVQNMYPYYGQYAQNIHGPGFGVQYPQMTQIPVLSQNYGSSGILSFPSSTTLPTISPANVAAAAIATTTTATTVAVTGVTSSQATETTTDSEQKQQHSTT
ncbi:unnamed protein product [Lathyrus oleraceus]|uniref:RRM domain-containing protein n=1 Tax=Pisum sativum TaxID=3888 RepID=A0A9D4XKZ4_PEA|nr:uncharacterized protein LOC127076133 isoform X2 [Pisum sativum]KAI5422142.1 hypothetical protein KIW84_045558 [Pisum sativum]